MNLSLPTVASLLQLLKMAEVCASEASKGLAFGMKFQAEAEQPKVILANRMNGQAIDPADFARKASAGNLNSFVNHTQQLVQYANAIHQAMLAATGQAKPDAGEDEQGGSGPIAKLG